MYSLNADIIGISIKVTDKCNLACRYCIQTDEKARKEDMPEKINPDIYSFINNVKKESHTSFHIFFTGGEPLLFLDNIKEIINNLNNPHIKYTIFTNGLLIDQDFVNYCNTNKITVSISYEGKASQRIRGIDIFNDNNRKTLFYKINKLQIASVLSAEINLLELVEDIKRIQEEYHKVNNNGSFNFMINEIEDYCLKDRNITKFDYNKLYNQTRELLKKYNINLDNYSNYIPIVSDILLRYIDVATNIIKNPLKYKENMSHIYNLQSIYMDLGGNLLSQSSSRKIYGNASNSNIIDYLYNDYKFNNYNINNYCKDCNQCILNNRCGTKKRTAYIGSIGGNKDVTCKIKKTIIKAVIEHLYK